MEAVEARCRLALRGDGSPEVLGARRRRKELERVPDDAEAGT